MASPEQSWAIIPDIQRIFRDVDEDSSLRWKPPPPLKEGHRGSDEEHLAGRVRARPGGDARGALGTAGAMGRAELMTGFVAPHST